MPNDDQKPAMPEPPSEAAVQCSAWLAALEEHIRDMKYREEEHRRQSDDARLKAETVAGERHKLEHALYKAKLRS
jgi:hypothetical protein